MLKLISTLQNRQNTDFAHVKPDTPDPDNLSDSYDNAMGMGL